MVTSDPLCVAWRLSLYGLRRGQALSLRWPDIDQRARMLTVNQVRLLIGYPVPHRRSGVPQRQSQDEPFRTFVERRMNPTSGR